MPATQAAYYGEGTVELDAEDIGQVSKLVFTHETETKKLPNRRGGGGNWATLERVTGVKVAITLHDMTPANFARLTRGTVSAGTAGRSVINVLTEGQATSELVFKGLNAADNDDPVTVTAFLFKPGVTKDLSLIGDDFASFELEGEILADPTKTGAGVSKFYTVDIKATV